MKTDTLFYRLFKNAPELALQLADLNDADTQNYRFSSEEIKQTAFRLDGILTPPQEHTDLPVIFVEVQFQKDPNFYSRFFCEIFFYLQQNKPINPWQALIIYPARKIIYPARKTETKKTQHYTELLHSNRIKRIYLDDLANHTYSSEKIGLQLIQLIVTAENQTPNKAQNIVQQIKTYPDQQASEHWLEWVETILVYKLPTLSRQESQDMSGYNDIELQQTQFYKDVFSEGFEQGKLNAKLKGKLEGEITIILRILKRKLGPLSEKTHVAIQALNDTQLEALSDHLLDFSSKNDLDNWLKQNQ
ncbi:MAG: Rpn family recombination-promoting nuclease/putative transposase [Methyloprofundus sp.]|nr:Rpn family recombination-promoting nuclease/putative transposase [Methyloprofundus sp.]